jgi:hypothetical protein
MTKKILDNNQSYLLGFLQSDGHRNSTDENNIAIELAYKDIDILEKIKNEFLIHNIIYSRIRDTNFKKNYKSCSLRFHTSYVADLLNYLPIGTKSEIVRPPQNIYYSETDYWRGFIDGDGSIGFRKTHNKKLEPFISIGTSSEPIARTFEKFVFEHCYSKNKSNRNKRDDAFNITIGGLYGLSMIKKIYYKNCFGLDRKIIKAQEISRSNFKSEQKTIQFSRDEDILLLNHKFDKKYCLPNRLLSVSRARLRLLLSKNIDTVEKLFDINYFV